MKQSTTEEEVVEVQSRAEDPDGPHMARICHHSVSLVQNTRQNICYYSYLFSVELSVAYLRLLVA